MSELLIILKEGCIVCVIGMGVVFIFLTLMIFAMNITSKIILYLNKIFPEVVMCPNKPTTNKKNKNFNQEESIAVAIAALIAKR